jgi:HlyD family secretion protein
MTKKVKIGIAGAVGLVVILVAVLGAAKRGNKSVEVRIEPVEKRDLIASVTASGQVRPQTKVDIASDVAGKIMQLSVREGQMVTRGQFLLQIDPEQAQAAVSRAEASLAAAQANGAQQRANLIQAERSYERMLNMQKANAQLVSVEQLDQLKTSVDVNRAVVEASTHTVDQARAALRDARNSLSKTRLFAPMSGRVTRLVVEQGETAVPGTFNKDAATLLTISDMTVLETKVKVDETDVARISIGDSAVVQIDAFPDTTFVGRVSKISNSSVRGAAVQQSADQAVDYEVTIQLVNAPAETRPDFSATAKVITDTRKTVLSIPIIALTVRENENLTPGDTAVGLGKARPTKDVGKKDVEGVFVVGDDNKVTFRPVKVGIAGEKHFEVLNGLKDGEKIVAGTYQAIRELKDGVIVRATKVPDANAKAKSVASKTT